MGKKIQISDEVWAEIARRGSFGESEDDVLRRVFGLQPDLPSASRRSKGAEAAAWGKSTANALAKLMGAENINPRANEYVLGDKRFTIRCARVATNSVGVTFKMLDRIDEILAALEIDQGKFEVYRLGPTTFRSAMRMTGSKGPSSGKVGIVLTKVFREEGTFVGKFTIK